MRVVNLTYERTFNLGNYQSEKIGVEVALDSNDNANEALERAKKFVEGNQSK
jgi:hypothetical protein